MKKYGIVVDSTLNLSQDLIDKYNIKVANLTVAIDNVLQPQDITNTVVLNALAKGINVKTSQPSSDDFRQKYLDFLNNGYDEVLSITMSSTLSGTFNSANLAVDLLDEDLQDKVHVFDTESVTMGAMYYAELAIKLLYEEKINMVQTIKHLTKAKDQGHLVFVVDDLGTIYRQGRLGRIKYILGSILKVKPILVFQRNVLDIASRSARGFKGAFKFIENRISNFIAENPNKKYLAWLAYVDREGDARNLFDQIEQAFPKVSLRWAGFASHVIGAHIGPGGMGIYLAYED